MSSEKRANAGKFEVAAKFTELLSRAVSYMYCLAPRSGAVCIGLYILKTCLFLAGGSRSSSKTRAGSGCTTGFSSKLGSR